MEQKIKITTKNITELLKLQKTSIASQNMNGNGNIYQNIPFEIYDERFNQINYTTQRIQNIVGVNEVKILVENPFDESQIHEHSYLEFNDEKKIDEKEELTKLVNRIIGTQYSNKLSYLEHTKEHCMTNMYIAYRRLCDKNENEVNKFFESQLKHMMPKKDRFPIIGNFLVNYGITSLIENEYFKTKDESSDRLFTITDKISNISKTKLELIVDTYGQHLIGTP